MFDIKKKDAIGFTNIGCFNGDQTNELVAQDNVFATKRSLGELRKPVLSRWIFAIPIGPSLLNFEEQILAGEIALYIYYSLFLARNKNKK